jgi:hypothetical protein
MIGDFRTSQADQGFFLDIMVFQHIYLLEILMNDQAFSVAMPVCRRFRSAAAESPAAPPRPPWLLVL